MSCRGTGTITESRERDTARKGAMGGGWAAAILCGSRAEKAAGEPSGGQPSQWRTWSYFCASAERSDVESVLAHTAAGAKLRCKRPRPVCFRGSVTNRVPVGTADL